MSIGRNIKLYLVKNNISQISLSKKTNMTPSQLSGILNETRKMTVEEYISITNALNVPINSFAGEKTLSKK